MIFLKIVIIKVSCKNYSKFIYKHEKKRNFKQFLSCKIPKINQNQEFSLETTLEIQGVHLGAPYTSFYALSASTAKSMMYCFLSG